MSGGVLAWLSLERDADLHMAQLMPLPLTVSCFSEIQIGFTFLVPAHPALCRVVLEMGVCVLSFYFTKFLLHNIKMFNSINQHLQLKTGKFY